MNERMQEWLNGIVSQFGGSAYLVGSALWKKKKPRDVDLRLLLPDDKFEELFGPVRRWVIEGETGNWTELRWNWSRLCTKLTKEACEVLGANIDFQIYPESWARMEYGREPRILLAGEGGNSMSFGYHVPALVREIIMCRLGVDYGKAQEIANELDQRLSEAEWLALFNGTTFEKAFTPSLGGIRREIREFAKVMEEQLKMNDWKGGWKGASVLWLFGRMIEELKELYEALHWGRPNEIRREAADVANFAMMIADSVSEEEI